MTDGRAGFPVGTRVRYQPGIGTYGYEDCLEADGRLPGVVRGHTRTRVQVELTLTRAGRVTTKRVQVAAASLEVAP